MIESDSESSERSEGSVDSGTESDRESRTKKNAVSRNKRVSSTFDVPSLMS